MGLVSTFLTIATCDQWKQSAQQKTGWISREGMLVHGGNPSFFHRHKLPEYISNTSISLNTTVHCASGDHSTSPFRACKGNKLGKMANEIRKKKKMQPFQASE